MYRALTAEQARSIEEQAIARQGVTLGELMRAAGAAIAREVAERVPHGEVVVLAGPGNNGGDGWVAAREMAAAGRPVRVLSLKDPSALTGDAAHAASDAIAAGVPWRLLPEMPAEDDLASAVVVVDALLGTGSSGALRAPLDEWVVAANASGAYMVSADVPTGVDSDSGAVPGPAIQADCTVTFTAPKRGLVLYPGAAHAGEVIVADIGIDPGLADVPGALEVWVREEYASLLPLPAPDVHKNRRGRVLVVAGSGAFPGAAVLAARGAMRSGAGYVTLAVPDSVVPIAQAHLLAVPVVGLPQSSRTRTLSSAAADKVLQLAREYDIPVVEDDPYGRLRFDGGHMKPLRSLDDEVIYLGTFSRIFAPGLRLGWITAPRPILAKVLLVKQAADLCGSNFAQVTAERYFQGTRWRRTLQQLTSTYAERRDAMLAALEEHFPPEAKWTHPEGGFYRETWRADEQVAPGALPARYAGPRSLGTAIYYLLTPASFSALHRVRSDEVDSRAWSSLRCRRRGQEIQFSIPRPGGRECTSGGKACGGSPDA